MGDPIIRDKLRALHMGLNLSLELKLLQLITTRLKKGELVFKIVLPAGTV